MSHVPSLKTFKFSYKVYCGKFLLIILSNILNKSLRSLRTKHLLSIPDFRLKLENMYRRLNKAYFGC